MKKKLGNLLSILLRDYIPGGYIPLENREHFSRDITFVNIGRAKILGMALLVLHVPFIYMDFINQRKAFWVTTPGYRYLFYMHLIMVAGIVLFLGLMKIRAVNSPNDITTWHRGLFIAFVSHIFIACACVSVVDQLIHYQITAYIIAAFTIASAVYIHSGISIPVFLAPYALLRTGLALYQPNTHILKGHFINASAVTAIAWILSRFFYSGYLRDFVNKDIIEKQRAILTRQSKEDFLTGMYNRRYLELLLSQEFARSRRYGLKLSVAMADIDFFKNINDSFSHGIGDRVLQTIALIFKKNIRSFDIIGRYGGEEFVFILPETDLEEAVIVCDRIRQSIEGHDWSAVNSGLKVTISFGVSDSIETENYEKLLSDADKKLYEAKESGRNQVRY